MIKNISDINEALGKTISKQIIGGMDAEHKAPGKKIIYKSRTPKTSINIAFIFNVSGDNDITISFGKIDPMTNMLTPNLRYIPEDFKYISSMRDQCVEDFLKNHSEYKKFIL